MSDEEIKALQARVGAVLRDLRTRQGLTQAALAKRCGVKQGSISQIESGDVDPQLSTLLRLTRALGVPFGDLVPSDGGTTTAYASAVERVRIAVSALSEDDAATVAAIVEKICGLSGAEK